MAHATPEDVAGRLGRPLTDDERQQASVLLEDVELIIRSRIPNLDERVSSGQLPKPTVVMVECYAVTRVLRNPEGFRREQDGDYSYSRDAQVASGRLTITDDEWRLLGLSPGAFTIAPYLCVDPTPPDPWRVS